MTNHDPIPARLAALKTMPTPRLKEQWREPAEPRPYNRRFIESGLAYGIQELAYGGLKPETVRRLEQTGEELDGGKVEVRRAWHDRKPLAGTRLVRKWQGVEHTVTRARRRVRMAGYRSLSAIARAPSPARAGTGRCSSGCAT